MARKSTLLITLILLSPAIVCAFGPQKSYQVCVERAQSEYRMGIPNSGPPDMQWNCVNSGNGWVIHTRRAR